MFYLLKSPRLIASLLMFVFISNTAYAEAVISFSRYRIALSDEARSSSLTVYNQGNSDSRCNLGFSYNKVLPSGLTVQAKSGDEIFNNADKMVRFSPRRVTVPAAGSQTVRLSMKKLRNQADGEYVTYLQLRCLEVGDTVEAKGNQGTAMITPSFAYNIPVVARVGDFNAKASLSATPITNGHVTVTVNREGNRSLYGDITITDSTGKTVGLMRNVAVYLPATSLDVKIRLTEQPQGPISVAYEESVNYGGDIKIML